MSKQKLDQETLEQEIEDGKTVKQIAHEYGYGYPSRTLNERIRGLNYKRLSKFNFYSSGGANVSFTSEMMEEALEKSDTDKETEDDNVYYTVNVTDSGEIVLTPKENGLVKNDK